MPALDIFNNDAFSVTNLTKAINDTPHMPTRIGEMKLFEESGINTTSVLVERRGTTLTLVPAGVRGESGPVKSDDKRTMVSLTTNHLPQRASVLADEVLNVRGFGSETELEAVQNVVNRKLGKVRRDLDVTIEWQRLGAIKGQVLDADGTTVLTDSFSTFGFTQQVKSMALSSNTKVRTSVVQAKRLIEAKLGAKMYRDIIVLCSAGFFDALVDNADVKEAYDRYLNGQAKRDDVRTGFALANVTFEEYRGKVGSQDFIADGDAFMIPLGVPDMFVGHYAPADYMETVGTQGVPFYAKQELKPFNKGVDIEAQSNPLFFNTQPDAVIRLTAS